MDATHDAANVFRLVFTDDFRADVESFIKDEIRTQMKDYLYGALKEAKEGAERLQNLHDYVNRVMDDIRATSLEVKAAAAAAKDAAKDPRKTDVDWDTLAQPLQFDWNLLRVVAMTKLNGMPEELGRKEVVGRHIGVPPFSAWVRGAQETLSVEYTLRVCAWLGDSPFDFCKDAEDVEEDNHVSE